jgi:hypothetical protein
MSLRSLGLSKNPKDAQRPPSCFPDAYYVEGINNPADLFTKNLRPIKFSKFRSQLGLEFYST